MTLFHVLVLGAIEGFTEFLPISSTAHLLIASRFLGIPSTEFLKTFIIAIQLGSILAVVVLYAKTFLKEWQVNLRIVAAFLPTAFFGFILYHFIKGFLFENMGVIIAALFLGGVGLVLFERWYQEHIREPHILHTQRYFRLQIPHPFSKYSLRVFLRRVSGFSLETPAMVQRKRVPEHAPLRATERGLANIPYWKACVIGCAQALAVVPGVSRAGATIVAGMLLGIERSEIVEFSFLLAVPTMAAATGYDMLKSGAALNAGEFHLIALGFLVSFAFAIIGVKFFINLIKTRSFTSFGVYRIVLALFLFGLITTFSHSPSFVPLSGTTGGQARMSECCYCSFLFSRGACRFYKFIFVPISRASLFVPPSPDTASELPPLP